MCIQCTHIHIYIYIYIHMYWHTFLGLYQPDMRRKKHVCSPLGFDDTTKHVMKLDLTKAEI